MIASFSSSSVLCVSRWHRSIRLDRLDRFANAHSTRFDFLPHRSTQSIFAFSGLLGTSRSSDPIIRVIGISGLLLHICQVSRISRETHAFSVNSRISARTNIFSRIFSRELISYAYFWRSGYFAGGPCSIRLVST